MSEMELKELKERPRYIVYLAGPITACSFDQCTDWRDQVCDMLPPEIEGMSPMRGKHYLEGGNINCKVL